MPLFLASEQVPSGPQELELQSPYQLEPGSLVVVSC
jgi:hypothetical protein